MRRCDILFQVFAGAKFQQGYIDQIIPFGNPDAGAEFPDGFRGVPTSAQSGDGWHPGIVPPVYMLFIDQLQELALAHDGVGEVETGKFILP